MWEEANQDVRTERGVKKIVKADKDSLKEAVSIGDMFIPLSFPLLVLPAPPSAHRRAPPLWLRCQRKSSTLPSCLFFFFLNCSSPPPFPSDSRFSLSRFLKCCFFKMSPKQLSSETLCIFIYIWTGLYAFYGCVGFVKWPTEVPDSFVWGFFVCFSVIIVRESGWNHCLGGSRVTGALCNTENQIG